MEALNPKTTQRTKPRIRNSKNFNLERSMNLLNNIKYTPKAIDNIDMSDKRLTKKKIILSYVGKAWVFSSVFIVTNLSPTHLTISSGSGNRI